MTIVQCSIRMAAMLALFFPPHLKLCVRGAVLSMLAHGRLFLAILANLPGCTFLRSGLFVADIQ